MFVGIRIQDTILRYCFVKHEKFNGRYLDR